jgi:hypothetical protein
MFLGTLLHRIFEASLIAKGKIKSAIPGFSNQTHFQVHMQLFEIILCL